MMEVLTTLDAMRGSILPTSARKISECKMLFDAHVDANTLVQNLEARARARVLKRQGAR